jgi:hypothetical protein
VEQWLPEISKAAAVESDRPISPHIFAAAWLIDGSSEGEGIALYFCG